MDLSFKRIYLVFLKYMNFRKEILEDIKIES